MWVDNLIYDDDAPLPTYAVRGTVTLSDNPPDQSGTIVTVLETGFADTTNAAGEYEIGGLINGLYTLAFHHDFYKDFQDTVRVQDGDAVYDVTLIRNHKPIANAGADISGAQVARYVYLDGSGSYDPDGDSLSYKWTQTGGPKVILGHADQPVAGFRPDTLGTYVFTLVVSDGTEESDPDSVTVEVTVPGPESYGYEYVSDFPGADTNVHGVGVDPEGKVWIGSYGGNSGIQVRYPDGTPAPFSPIVYGVVGEDTVWVFNRCRGIEIGPDGMVYVSTSSAEGGPAILKFDYRTGEPLGGIKRNASPAKVGVDQDGHIFVANVAHAANGYKITIYNADFDSVGVIDASPANGGPDFGFTRAIEVSPDGQKLFVGDLDKGGVYLFEGSASSGYTYTGEVPGPFLSVQGLDLDHHMRLWVHDGVQNSGGPYYLHIYSPDLEVRESLRMEGENRGAGFAMNDSLVYIIDFLRHKVERWAIKGTQVPPLATPLSVVARDDNFGKPTLLDSVITVSGFVTASNQFGKKGPAYIQDALLGNAGVAIYDQTVADSVKIGDRISITGKVGFFRGLTEIVDVQSLTIWSSGHEVKPRVVTCADLADGVGEALEGVLVMIRNVTTTATEFPSNGTITISDSTGSATVFIDRDTDIAGTPVVAQTFDIIGIVGQYDRESPYWQGYQLMPRSKADLPLATGVDEKGNSTLPKQFALYQNYPNPFNPTTTIRYDLPKAVHVKIDVYNVLGQKVATLVDEEQLPGFKSVVWDGRDDFGQPVSSGTYIYRIQAGDFVRTRKMTMLK
ncbi:MAG: T9SS type A sorting domain-containing protein [Calditrichaeota bacterium]|nr:T9SS type A sorting domain-containing protein [Calditrichota bacterium]